MKVLLNERNVDEAYAYMQRKPRAEYVKEHLRLLEKEISDSCSTGIS